MSQGLVIFGKKLGGLISKNSSSILTGVSVVGLVTTTILAVKATPKALILLENDHPNQDIKTLSFDKIVRSTWKCYMPAAGVGLATIACMVGSNSINLRRNAALAGLYGLTETAFKEYQNKVVETLGKNKENKMRDEIVADRLKTNPISQKEVIFTSKGTVLCYDSLSGRYFKSDIEQLRRVINILNHRLLIEDFISLNDFYCEIGLNNIDLGYDLGWTSERLIEVSFSSQLTDTEEPCLVLSYDIQPKFI